MSLEDIRRKYNRIYPSLEGLEEAISSYIIRQLGNDYDIVKVKTLLDEAMETCDISDCDIDKTSVIYSVMKLGKPFVFSADQAKSLTDEALKYKEQILYSGLSPIRQRFLEEIREASLSGNYTAYITVYKVDEKIIKDILKWLKELKYTCEYDIESNCFKVEWN